MLLLFWFAFLLVLSFCLKANQPALFLRKMKAVLIMTYELPEASSTTRSLEVLG